MWIIMENVGMIKYLYTIHPALMVVLINIITLSYKMDREAEREWLSTGSQATMRLLFREQR
jgi:hypothetical protein